MEANEKAYKIASLIYKTFTTVFLLIGTTTNVLSAIVYSRKKMRKTSYSFYLFSLALVDLFVILNGNIRIFFMSFEFSFLQSEYISDLKLTKLNDSSSSRFIFRGVDVRDLSLFMCRTHRFFTYFLLQLSSVILCMLSIDRFIGCVLVLKSTQFCKPSVARRIVLFTSFVLFLFNFHFLISMGYEVNVAETNRTVIKCDKDPNNKIYSTIWSIYFYLDTSVYCIIPFLIMITCNISIISKIINSRITSRKVVVVKKKNSNQNFIAKNSNSLLATEKRISIILVVISLSFLVLTIPVFIMENLNESYFNNPIFEIALAFSYMLMYLNHVINFFFYCSLGPSFRNEVKKLFPRFFCINNKIDPVKMSRYNTVLFANTSLNPRNMNMNKITNNEVIVSYFKSTKVDDTSDDNANRTSKMSLLYTSSLTVVKKVEVHQEFHEDEVEEEEEEDEDTCHIQTML